MLVLVQGEYEIDTTRKDLGSLKTITADDITADVTYYHVRFIRYIK